MDIIIQEWLKEIATKNSSASPDLVYFSNNDTCNSSMPYKNEIGEVAIHDIINIYIDSQIVSLESNIEKNDIALTGSGSFSLSNGDYFRGDFLGNLSDREGKFTRLSNGGCTIEGTWKDGRAEVSTKPAYYSCSLVQINLVYNFIVLSYFCILKSYSGPH